jgi:hypothetical protein
VISRILASILAPAFGCAILAGAPPGATVYFIGLNDGDTLPTKAMLHFGLRGMGVAPAGSDREGVGPPAWPCAPIPATIIWSSTGSQRYLGFGLAGAEVQMLEVVGYFGIERRGAGPDGATRRLMQR